MAEYSTDRSPVEEHRDSLKHTHRGRYRKDCPACQHNDANWRRQLKQQADLSRDAEALLWAIASAKRSYITDGDGNAVGMVVWTTEELLDRIDQTIGYDEQGG